jgi:hypothetical protein
MIVQSISVYKKINNVYYNIQYNFMASWAHNLMALSSNRY